MSTILSLILAGSSLLFGWSFGFFLIAFVGIFIFIMVISSPGFQQRQREARYRKEMKQAERDVIYERKKAELEAERDFRKEERQREDIWSGRAYRRKSKALWGDWAKPRKGKKGPFGI